MSELVYESILTRFNSHAFHHPPYMHTYTLWVALIFFHLISVGIETPDSQRYDYPNSYASITLIIEDFKREEISSCSSVIVWRMMHSGNLQGHMIYWNLPMDSSSSWFSAFLGRFIRPMAPFTTMSSSLLQLAVILFHHPGQ